MITIRDAGDCRPSSILFSEPSLRDSRGAEGKEGSRPQVHTKPQATVDLIHTTDVADNSRTLFHPLADTHIRAKREMREGRNTNEPQNLPFHPPRVMHMGGLCSADGVNRKGFWKPTTKQGPCAPPPPPPERNLFPPSNRRIALYQVANAAGRTFQIQNVPLKRGEGDHTTVRPIPVWALKGPSYPRKGTGHTRNESRLTRAI